MKHVVVLGGGITGLSAAYYVHKQFAEQSRPVRITLLERAPQLGGKIHTLRRDGFYVEKGPDSFLARKLPIIELTQELGLEDELVATNPQAKKTYIVSDNKLHLMPPGLVLGIPTELKPFLRTGLISWRGKARAVLDLVLPKRDDPSDESLGSFLSRRLGREVLDRIAEPLLAGIYAGDTHALSLQATFPQFQAVERKHRSLIRGMLADRKAAKPQSGASAAANIPAVAKSTVFLSYRRGLSSLVERLEEQLREAGAELRTGSVAEAVEKSENGVTIRLAGGEKLEADGVIVTLPLYALRPLFGGKPLPAMDKLTSVPYVSVANIIMGFDAGAIGHPLDGSGFLVPRRERRFITACTWTSSKWKHTAPEGKVLLRCYVGRSGEEGWTEMTDEQIVAKVRADVRDLTGIAAEPLFAEVTRLHRSMPQYPVGHLDNIQRAREELAERLPGVWIAGAGFHGVGLPDCIRQGKEAAQVLYRAIGEGGPA